MFYVGVALVISGLFLYFRRKKIEAAREEKGPAEATLEDYFSAITRLTEKGYGDGEFAILTASDKMHFVQVGLHCDKQDAWSYQFDIPNVAWSADYVPMIEAEAKRRGLKPYTTDGTSSVSFLDIDFTDRAAHDDFATWVIRDVFRIPEGEKFYVETS